MICASRKHDWFIWIQRYEKFIFCYFLWGEHSLMPNYPPLGNIGLRWVCLWMLGSVAPSAPNLRKQRLLKAEIYSAVGPLSKCVQRLVIFQISQEMYFWRIFKAPWFFILVNIITSYRTAARRIMKLNMKMHNIM